MTQSKAKKKILLVDDQEPVRQMLAATVKDEGRYIMLHAHDGASALQTIKQERPDLVLLDVIMPGIDGLEVCRQIKADPNTSKAIVIMLSALASDKDIEDATKAGADGYIAKPFSPIGLLKRVEETFGF
ncbi:MAG: response regulator [Chloroflexi bacterium]|nr:response regulator [Chloroflexota bacterium]